MAASPGIYKFNRNVEKNVLFNMYSLQPCAAAVAAKPSPLELLGKLSLK